MRRLSLKSTLFGVDPKKSTYSTTFGVDPTKLSKFFINTLGAQEGTRTPTPLRAPAPKADVSTNFTT